MTVVSWQWSVGRKNSGEKPIRQFILFWLLTTVLLTTVSLAEAQQPTKVPRIGVLAAPNPSFFSIRFEAFRQGLRELGYLEGKNISIEYRYAEGKLDRLPHLAAELVHLKVDLILTAGESGALAAKNATGTIPVVFAVTEDAVESGLVSSLARPGVNVTGLTVLSAELGGKRLELLKESLPRVSRVAFLWPSGGPRGKVPFTEMEAAAKAFGIKLQSLPVRDFDDFQAAFEAAKRDGAQALITTPSPVMNTQRDRVLDFAAKNRLPAIYAAPEFVDAGGLMYYGPNYLDLFRRAATYVDKILKGAKPAGLPVEQPTKFELIINLRAAKQIGLTIPPNVLTRADKVIK
jgi:putative tryptophan/tyrosine transport system substrate-binding protein